MSDQPLNDLQSQDTPPAEAQNTEQLIPKSRFDEVNKRMKEAEKQLKELMNAHKDREEQDAISKGEAQKLIDQWKPKVQRLEALESTIAEILENELSSLAEEQRESVALVLDAIGTPEAKLKALRGMQAILRTAQPATTKPTPPNTDAGAGVKREQGANFGLTPDEIKAAQSAKMTLEEYAAIKKKMNGE